MSLNWFILYMNDPRKIKYLSSALRTEGISGEIWLPLQRSLGAKVLQFKPLFPGYVFIGVSPDYGDIEQKLREADIGIFLKTPGSDRSALLTMEQFEYLKALELEYRKEPEPCPKPLFEINQQVEIKAGPFAGMPGRVIEVKKDTVKVELCIFSRVVSAEISTNNCCKFNE